MAEFTKPTKEQIEEGLRLLAKKMERDEKVAKGELKPSYKKVSEMTPEEKKKYQETNARYTAKNTLLLRKAVAAGITVSEAEIDQHLKKK